jgi:hypothetical protein
MPSTYTSSLRLVLPATGELSNTWGTVFNAGATSLIDSSIAGTSSITMTAANYTLTSSNGASDEARAMFLVLGGTPGGSYNVIVPAVSKLYFVTNSTGAAQTVKTSAGSGISVPNGARMTLRCDGTDVLEAQTYFGSLTLGAALPVASGGTGATTLTGVLKGNGTSAFTASNVNLASEVTGTLPVANGGTGAATFTTNNVLLGNGTSAFQVVAPGTNGNVLTSNGTTWQSTAPATNVSTISFGSTGLTPSTATSGAVSVAGTLAIANGGTGATTLAGANIPVTNAANTFTAAQTFRAANAIRSEAASTQDAVVIAGRAGGTSSYAVTLTPTTLSANRTVTIPNETFTVGFRNLPAVGTQTGSYTLAVNDVGKYVQVSTGGSITIPTSTFAEGDAITIYNNTTGNITITCSAPTAYIAGTNTVKTSMTLATRGVATVLFYSATACVVTGNVT